MKTVLMLEVFLVGFLAAMVSVLLATPLVQTKLGTVAGLEFTSRTGKIVNVFYGIPYAVPPIAKRRFLKTEPRPSWEGVLNATYQNPGCVQTDVAVAFGVTLNMSKTVEDCLYLNIWAPRRDCASSSRCDKLSVFVYIYGGAFTWGTSALLLYDGLEFAARTDMIFVTFNYRVGVLGFLNVSSAEAPGNMGLFDQVEALRWVKSNIEHFGGDPDSITIGGQSAGAISASYHMMSKLSKGLFRRAVLLSGAPATIAYGQLVDPLENFRSIIGLFSCNDPYVRWDQQIRESVECLRKVDAHKMLKSLYKHLMLRYVTFLPGHGDDIMPTDPLNLGDMQVHTKEILMGTTEDDGAFLVEQLGGLVRTIGVEFDGRQILRMILKILYNMGLGASEVISDAYFGVGGGHDVDTSWRVLTRIATDVGFECPTDFHASQVAQDGTTVYRYLFAHRPSYSYWSKWISATHNDELPFFLGTIRLDPHLINATYGKDLSELYRGTLPSSEEFQFSDEMLQILAQFSKTGKPKIPRTNKDWPKYTKENKAYLILKPNDYRVAQGPRSTKCHLWEPYLVKRKPTATTPSPKARPSPKHGLEKRPKLQVHPLDNNIAVASVASILSSVFSFVMAAAAAAIAFRGL